MANNKNLKFLECFCVKRVSPKGGVIPSSASISAKISCNPLQIKSKVVNLGSVRSSKDSCTPSVHFEDSGALGSSKYVLIFKQEVLDAQSIVITATGTVTASYDGNTYIYTVTDSQNYGGDKRAVFVTFKESTSGSDDAILKHSPAVYICNKVITNPFMSRIRKAEASLGARGNISGKISVSMKMSPSPLTAVGSILMPSGMLANYSFNESLDGPATLNPKVLEKIRGDFGDFGCVQKLYPIDDVATDINMGKFVGPYKESGNLYTFIDDGVFTGDHGKAFAVSTIVSDDNTSYIQPDTFHTDGNFQYKCKLTNVLIKPENSRLRIRTSAPLNNYEAKIPPKYTIHNAKLNDPSGNLIVQYNDIVFKGDSDQYDKATQNYMTLSMSPKINRTTEYYEWQYQYPFLREGTGYTLSFDVKVEALDDAYTEGFDEGFEENYIIHDSYASGSDYLALDGSPLATQDQSLINPTKNIRISAVEICNSGAFPFGQGWGPRKEDYLKLYTEVPAKGRRIEKKIVPDFMPLADFDTGVWPSVSSVWHPNADSSLSNQDECGAKNIVENISDGSTLSYATISGIGPHLDSGKLTLRFTHGGSLASEVSRGAFDCGFDQNVCPTWFGPSGAFNTENNVPKIGGETGFFDVESVTLKVTARKAVGSRDFALDVVGYSDDGLLNITKAPSGFLQNPSGVQINNLILASEGIHPYISGFNINTDDLAISAESLSEKDSHFEASGNVGGDHYSITTYPIVNSTSWAEYEVPLKIFDDNVKIGKSRDYSMSSLFERLYLDIYPIPSGASIADIHLLVRFAPQDAFNLTVEGGEKIRKAQKCRSETKLFPSARGSANDAILNAGSGYGPISNIEGIPHGYSTPSSIKTNYSRRWRGMEGTVQGPYDPDMFAFGFENPLLDYPFLSGYYDFTDVEGLYVKSRSLGTGFGNASGLLKATPQVYQNFGWRFTSGVTLFENELPGYTGGYKTSDWTALSKGAANFQSHNLYGKIADAFDSVVRISGFNQNINFGNIDTASGFSIFARFTPDITTSGNNSTTNLFNSGVIFSKWTSANNLDFALGYSGGHLCGYAKDTAGNLVTVKDTLRYDEYQYPVSVLLTYNDHHQRKLKLYTDNEANSYTYSQAFEEDYDGEHIILRAASSAFFKNITNSDFVVGHCDGSGVGMNMLLAELGISTYESGVNSGGSVIYPYGSGTNIVESHPDKTHKQVTASKFFDNHRAKFFQPEEDYNTDSYELWDYVNEDMCDWQIGDFKYPQFGAAFSRWSKRSGSDLISFNIKHHGSGYIQYADFAMPATVDSGTAYHTQLENDFLRFHLTETPDNFYSVHRRITKNLPVGYKFSENALVVETVIEHKTDNDIFWPECQPTKPLICSEHKHSHDESLYGPKLIVSLYTKRQERAWSSEPNWGLINRSIHYVQPSSCITRLDSKFTYDNLLDESEKWSIFPTEPRSKDFGERLFSDDVDDMFVQYDLVYPSGSPFESRIDIHTAHVRMGDAYVKATSDKGDMNIYASGANVLNYNLNTFVSGAQLASSGIFNLHAFAGDSVPNSGLTFNVSGTLSENEGLSIFTFSTAIPVISGFNLNMSGELRPTFDGSGSLNLVFPEVLGTGKTSLPLSIFNGDTSFIPSGGLLDLFIYAASGGATGMRGVSPLQLRVSGSGPGVAGLGADSLNMNMFGFSVPENRFPSSDMTLFIDTPLDRNVTLPLFLSVGDGVVNTVATIDGGAVVKGLNLFTSNYGGRGSDYLMWYNNSFGTTITQEDNAYAKVPVGNEIRGVDLIGYGSCTGNSPSKAIDPAVITDDTVWRPKTCEEGGILRAKATYTNPTASGFGNTVGYSGNYYGIRKYTGLSPWRAYEVDLKIVTGSTDPVKVPRELEDWEYGHCGPEHFVDAGGTSGCCASDCDQSLVYSGIKMIGDSVYLNGDKDLTPISGRNTQDRYGKAVSVVGDLMAVSSPNINIPVIETVSELESGIDNAGAVFLYRRGADVAGRKAAWQMEDKIMLPSGYRKDYILQTRENLIQYDQWSISGHQWAIGQEGRKFGSSLDVCSSGDRETLVIGAPYASWHRQFDEIVTSGIPVAMMVFTDSFRYSKGDVEEIAGTARKWDILYKYFSAPWYGATNHEFQPQLDVKLFVFQLVREGQDQPPVKHDHPWFRHKYISRMDDKKVTDDNGIQATYDSIYSGVKDEFLSAFRVQFGPHSGLPPIMGVFREKSNSAGLGAFYNPLDGKNIVDEFIGEYQNYTYQSGVVDPEVPTAETGYFNKSLGASENWVQTSKKLLNDTLGSGNLMQNDALRFITSGVGQEWAQSNAYEFQIPPSSGGRVFIFEKESGIFNCVQEIKSFADRSSNNFDDDLGADDGVDWFGYGSMFNDRYGHSVSISKNSEIISIGSPFTHTPCEIYARDDKANTTMYGKVRDYLVGIGDTTAVTRYDTLLADSGTDIAQRVSYHEMSQSSKLGIRLKNNIQLYKPVFNYKYSDIKTTGTWKFILGEFLGTSRLGYSTAVSDDGDIVAFGAPTDSMNLFEDSNVWFKGMERYASYTNAGAVRMFESKKIYPHSGVVEFTRFGNKDRAHHPVERDKGFYDQMGLYFQPSNLPFRRTDFEEIEIPRDAGLAFIITPELDAASDEIIANIKDWLALGDRTLVLVGNDPVYEENGLYKESNDVINKVLKKLNSRMRLHPAESKQLSLPDCVSSDEVFSDRYNITKAHQTQYAHTKYGGYESNITRDENLFAKGVGDIRIDLSDINEEGLLIKSPCGDLNPEVCNLPIKHDGDLRSEWLSRCLQTVGDRVVEVKYWTNWGFHFGNPNPAQSCDDYPQSPKPVVSRPYQDPVAILTTAEFLPDQTIIIPATSGENCEEIPCYKTIKIPKFSTYWDWADTQDNFIDFSVQEGSDSVPSGTFNSWSFGSFEDPDPKNGRDCLLRGVAELYKGTPKRTSRKLLDDSILALQESYFTLNEDDSLTKTTSKAVIVASLFGENSRSFGMSADPESPSKNDDQNVLFYVNMLTQDCEHAVKVLQLGGWTGRTSFKNAYSSDETIQADNLLKERFESYGIQVEENVVFTSDIPENDSTTGNEVKALWIANPAGKPSDEDVGRIRDFLNREDKRIIITYFGNDVDNAQQIAGNVDYICEKLNLQSRPCFVPSMGEYFVQNGQSILDGNEEDFPYSDESPVAQKLHAGKIPTSGCEDGYGWYAPHSLEPVDTKVEKLALWGDKYGTGGMGEDPYDYIPVSGGGDFERIVSYNDPIKDTETFVPDLYKFKVDSTASFPTVPGSGYRMFVNHLSETENEHYEITMKVDGVKFLPSGENTGNDGTGMGQQGVLKLHKTEPRDLATQHIDFVAVNESTTVTFKTHYTGINPEEEKKAGRGLPPLTTRFLSISGCPMEIVTKTTMREESKRIPCDPPFTTECTFWKIDEQIIHIPGEFRPVKHPSDPYCCCPDCPPRNETEIEDGPVVAAEEFENFSAGLNGNRRSKIVVLSDSTMIQGQCEQYRSDALYENQAFIRSLYPTSAEFDGAGDFANQSERQNLTGEGARRFQFTQKLRAPERGSAAKYYAVSGISNTTNPLYKYGGVAGNLDRYDDDEDYVHPGSPGFERQADPIGFKKGQELKKFVSITIPKYGVFPRYSGDFFGLGSYQLLDEEEPRDFLADADAAGGLPDLMKYNGTDYLDFDIYNSGCPGDLFGFSLDLSQNKLIVGTPFNAFRTDHAISGISGIVKWHEIEHNPSKSGIELCQIGGAGAAFYWERTGSGETVRDEFLPWEWKQKIRPSSINVGLINPSIGQLYQFDAHNLDAGFVSDHAGRPDQFGHSVAIDSDVIAIGAPNHDYTSLHDHSVYTSGQFIRKEFNREFIIPHHVVKDMGSSGVRVGEFANNSGTMVLNNGAVFTYKHQMTDFSNRTKEWRYKEKLYPQGFMDRTKANKGVATLSSGCENDHFGQSVALNRAKRGDSDYTLVVGAPFHDFATSGNHPASDGVGDGISAPASGGGFENAGSAYTFDGMLRDQTPSVPNSGGWIDVEVFGDRAATGVKTRVYQPRFGDPQSVTVSGLIFANYDGNIFLEASGFDPSQKGFIVHRPYVESVIGKLQAGTGVDSTFNLMTFGKPNSLDNAWPWISGNKTNEFSTAFAIDMDSLSYRPSGTSLYILGPDQANVYNSIDMNVAGVSGIPSGTMPLFTFAPSGSASGFLNLNMTSNELSGNLNLNVRGR